MRRDTETDHDEAATTPRRRLLLGSAGVLAGLAGCLGGGNGGDDSSSDGDSEPSDTNGTANGSDGTGNGTGQSIESMCQVQDDSLDEFSIVGCQSEVQGENFVVDLQVQNDGEQEADLFDYDFTVTPYDAAEASDSNDIYGGGGSTFFGRSSVVQPGDATSVEVTLALVESASPSDVELYTVAVECTPSSPGVYCQ